MSKWIDQIAAFEACESGGRGGVRIAIECDGHDFHERTPEQAQRDKSRDRFLSEQGWIVLRFTGREITRDARSCALQAINAFKAATMRQSEILEATP